MSWRSFEVEKNKQLLLFVAASKSCRITVSLLNFSAQEKSADEDPFVIQPPSLNFPILLDPTSRADTNDSCVHLTTPIFFMMYKVLHTFD